MVVFGIDPGSQITGFGVIRTHRGRMLLVDAGFVRTTRGAPVSQRLQTIYRGLVEAFARHPEVDAVAIEAIFRHKSSESAIRLGQARGVALLAAAEAGHDPVPYNPSTVKRTIGTRGGADKDAVARVVGMLLGGLPEGPPDIADALAIAITHASHARNAGTSV